MKPPWRNYEEVTRYILNLIVTQFDLHHVEGLQSIVGRSGVTWEIDGKGVCDDGKGVIIECKHYLERKITQGTVAEMAYKIQDIEAIGGMIVSPEPLQSGAKRLAEYEGIIAAQLNRDGTIEDFTLQALRRMFHGVGVRETTCFGDFPEAEIIRAKDRSG